RHIQDSESIGCETEIRLGIAKLPTGDPLDLKVALRTGCQLDGHRLRGWQAVSLYREVVAPRREIVKEIGTSRNIADGFAIREYYWSCPVNKTLPARRVPSPKKPDPRRPRRDCRNLRFRSGRDRSRRAITKGNEAKAEQYRHCKMVSLHGHSLK